jgi:hypothetical protein
MAVEFGCCVFVSLGFFFGFVISAILEGVQRLEPGEVYAMRVRWVFEVGKEGATSAVLG